MEIIKALLIAGLPIMLVSYLMIYWAIQYDYISLDSGEKDLKKFKRKDNSVKLSKIHQKWVYFGGGFYGLMAMITYIHIEFYQVVDFFSAYSGLADLIEKISVGAVIGLIVDSFLNLVPAFTWFFYWPKHIEMQTEIYWLIAAFGGYQLGALLAREKLKTVNLWEK